MGDSRAAFLPIVLERNDDGYLASVPGISGAFAEGDSVEEALFNCVDVVKMIMAYRLERGEPTGLNEVDIPPETRLTVSMPVGML